MAAICGNVGGWTSVFDRALDAKTLDFVVCHHLPFVFRVRLASKSGLGERRASTWALFPFCVCVCVCVQDRIF